LRHWALFYRDVAEYTGGVLPFLRAGLAAGEPVAAAVPAYRLAELRTSLGHDARHVRLLDMTEEGRNPGRIIAGVLRAFVDEHPDRRVRIVGEPVWPARTDVEYPACVQHEALINLALADRDATILCPYDAAGLDLHVLADAVATHPVLVDESGERPSPAYDPAHMIGAYNVALDSVEERAPATRFMFSVSNLRQTRQYAVAQGRRLGLSEAALADLELIVSELASNSVLHGGGRGTLCVWAADGHLVCEVRDAGVITDPLAGRRRPSADRPGGRGLLLVNHLADLVRVHTGQAGTTMRVYLRTAGRPPSP
jgi:anti-sigma regulatory factor (Ser/Thr protein kinase)